MSDNSPKPHHVPDSDITHVVALSGGKDSTAMALRLHEKGDRDYLYFCTPTGDELPAMDGHWRSLERLLGQEIVEVRNRDLNFWIDHFRALPNWRQRWCTRLLKIEPCLAFLKSVHPAVLYVGLRADEELRRGIYSSDVNCRFPLREWGWGLSEVLQYLSDRGVTVPKRTDCARCYAQRLGQWKSLLEEHPDIYLDAELQELKYGHTFRSAQRDQWPADLNSLKVEFQSGRKVMSKQSDNHGACRVCSF
jgi:3'-phosphoadenosine 5'-phosphosulfate sulfotransferase (PAPS reductase)/FAD synthetase